MTAENLSSDDLASPAREAYDREAYLTGKRPSPNSAGEDLRLDALIEDAHRALDGALAQIEADGMGLAGIVGLFSGGNDSTTLAHLFRDRVTHYAHANTGIGIEQTRQYVRSTCAGWDVPLLEFGPKAGQGYEDLVLGRCKPGPRGKLPVVYPGGFPGPAQHGMFFQRLKERQLEQTRNALVGNPYRERVVFLAGRRADESARCKSRTIAGSMRQVERKGSVVWVSPILNWGKLDLNAYRRRFPDVPRNEVSDLLHMSGECLCGCFAHPGELEEVRLWFPEAAAYIDDLMERVEAQVPDSVPRAHCRWGWKGQGACASGLCNN